MMSEAIIEVEHKMLEQALAALPGGPRVISQQDMELI